MPRLDSRLKAVARQIRCHTHVDIGSDHGHLLKALLASGRIERGIAIENKTRPHANSSATLAGFNAELRFADGLSASVAGEADSLSICGMGGPSICRILDAYPQRVPATVILQPNCKPELVRDWGLRASYTLIDETIAIGRWRYVILRFELAMHGIRGGTSDGRLKNEVPQWIVGAKSEAGSPGTLPLEDPAYEGIDRDAARLFGPKLIRAWSDDFVAYLHEELAYLSSIDRLGDEREQRLATLERLLGS